MKQAQPMQAGSNEPCNNELCHDSAASATDALPREEYTDNPQHQQRLWCRYAANENGAQRLRILPKMSSARRAAFFNGTSWPLIWGLGS
jgi:hypothetical protein